MTRARPFPWRDARDLRAEIERMALDLPLGTAPGILGEPLRIGNRTAPNRLCAFPVAGCDAEPDGAPGVLTHRRYVRLAAGGFGTIWIEAVAAGGAERAARGALCLCDGTAERFAELVKAVRAAAEPGVCLVLQLAVSGMTDADGAALAHAAGQAAALGCDAIDLAWPPRQRRAAPGGEGTPSAPSREGRAFLERARTRIRAAAPDLAAAVRLAAEDGSARIGETVRALADAGFDVFAVAPQAEADAYPPAAVRDALRAAEAAQQAAPDAVVVAGGLTALRWLWAEPAAGALAAGRCVAVGFGRGALAYPSMARDLLRGAQSRPEQFCSLCGACSALARAGEATGCALLDREVYAPRYAALYRVSDARLAAEAQRCRDCAAAPCVPACPLRSDVPGFIRAYAAGDLAGAYRVLRRHNPLPEQCAQLCPAWMQCEGACVETVLGGAPVAIRDLQAGVCRAARAAGLIQPAEPTAHMHAAAAVVGGGPAGIACAVGLSARGVRVALFEREAELGGMPHHVIPSRRLRDVQPEIAMLLRRMIEAHAVDVHTRRALGRDLRLAPLREEFDAVFLAPGLWAERSLGRAPGVVDALTFLREVKSGRGAVSPRVAVLAGGDCAMDAARCARDLGAADVYVISRGPLSDLHWHGSAEWFREPGVHLLQEVRPAGYATRADGGLRGVELEQGGDAGGPERRWTLAADMAIEAMGLTVDATLRRELDALEFTQAGLLEQCEPGSARTRLEGVYAGGALVNGGASVAQCIAEGLRAAEEIARAIGAGQGRAG
jgi:dihydropyrimidine dehydrogenase (NAD+) subunit PreT